ncbi:MAG: Ig-like domain-containing protein, partial [Bacilli bacterium]|nr:Ig-like domain-containing protein [Bacilli bacterium]
TVKPEKPVIDSVDGNNTKVVKVNVSGFDTTSVRPSGIGKFVYTLNNDESTEKAQKATQTGVGRDGTACAASSASGNVTEVEDTCWLKGKYTGVLPIPANITGSDQKYDVRVWSVDRAGNKSDAYAMTEVTVKTGKKATGVTMKNGSTVIPNGGSCATDVLPGTTFKLTAEPVPTDADEKTVIWNMAVITTGSTPASVDSNGNVKALNVGTVDIIATIGSASTSCRLTVTNSITCAAGTYLPKGGTKCTQCPAGSYCPGGTYPIDDTKDQGKNPCAAGTYSAAGVAKCTACVQGSYSAAGATSCTACQSGKTTSAAGQTSCNANCSNAANAGTWKTAKWNTNNTMTDLCALNTCSGNYSVVGNTCVAYYNATYTLTSGTCTSTSDCSNALKASNVTTKVSSDKKVVTLTIPTTGNWNIEFYSSGKLKLDRSGLVVDLHAVGGGGGGAGANTEYRTGGGGGGYTKTLRNQTLGTIEYTVTIGAGGAGGASKANGGTGGTTSFATLISAAGGQGGKAGNPDAEQLGNGGNGGSGGGGSGIGWQSKCAAAGAGGSNGGNGGNVANNNLKNYGSGQGTTTRDFGESSGTLRAGGGGGRNGLQASKMGMVNLNYEKTNLIRVDGSITWNHGDGDAWSRR